MSGGTRNSALEVEGLKVHFGGGRSVFGAKPTIHAVDGVSFSVPAGKTFGIVGESGSGKTTTALAIMRLVHITEGRVMLGDTVISDLEKEDLRAARRQFQIVFQDPYSSLDPRKRAGEIVREPLDLMKIGTPEERDAKVSELFAQVGLRPEHLYLTDSENTVVEGTLELVENLGEYALVHLLTPSNTEFIAKTEKPPGVPKGSTLNFGIKPELAHFFDSNSGARIV